MRTPAVEHMIAISHFVSSGPPLVLGVGVDAAAPGRGLSVTREGNT